MKWVGDEMGVDGVGGDELRKLGYTPPSEFDEPRAMERESAVAVVEIEILDEEETGQNLLEKVDSTKELEQIAETEAPPNLQVEDIPIPGKDIHGGGGGPVLGAQSPSAPAPALGQQATFDRFPNFDMINAAHQQLQPQQFPPHAQFFAQYPPPPLPAHRAAAQAVNQPTFGQLPPLGVLLHQQPALQQQPVLQQQHVLHQQQPVLHQQRMLHQQQPVLHQQPVLPQQLVPQQMLLPPNKNNNGYYGGPPTICMPQLLPPIGLMSPQLQQQHPLFLQGSKTKAHHEVELRPTPTPDVTSIFPNKPNNSNLIQITPNNTDSMGVGPPPAGEVEEALLQYVSGRQLGGACGGQPTPPGVEEYEFLLGLDHPPITRIEIEKEAEESAEMEERNRRWHRTKKRKETRDRAKKRHLYLKLALNVKPPEPATFPRPICLFREQHRKQPRNQLDPEPEPPNHVEKMEEMPVYMQRHLNRLIRRLARQLDTEPSTSHSAYLVNRFQSNLTATASRECSSNTTAVVKTESTAFCILAEAIGTIVSEAVKHRRKNGTLSRPSLLVVDVNGMLSAFPAGGCEEAGGDGASEAGLLQALLSIQPQIVDACERAFFQAIQESPVKPGKRTAAGPSSSADNADEELFTVDD